jgi:hypothetical protein
VQKFKYNKISLSGSIEDRMAVTNVSMVAEPGTAREEQLELYIPDGAFVDFLEILVGNTVMRGTVKSADIAAAAYGNAVKNSQTAALALSRGNSVLSLKVSIRADDRTIVTVGYSHFLASRSGQYEYPFPLILWDNKATGQSVLPTLIADFLIVDADGLKSVIIPKLEIEDPSFSCDWSTTCGKGVGGGISKVNGNRAEVSLRPESKILGKDLQASVNGEVLLDLSIRITQNEPSGYRASPFGLLMLDREGYFSHIFRRAAGETLLPMPKRLVLVIDISASMLSRTCGACQTKKIDQAKSAVRAILQKLSDVDEFAILAFGSSTQVGIQKKNDAIA